MRVHDHVVPSQPHFAISPENLSRVVDWINAISSAGEP